MGIDEWWPKLTESAREFLMANNGDAVPAPIVHEIEAVSGVVGPDAWWLGESRPEGTHLSDRATEWIEEQANDEH